ncbi:MAG TPA: CHC2 zinc finger domain-containing protein [Thermoanaerobaculia bacterium]|nr:CHC2 zinc finger domain-containing protein [Thermoanaerobaculia bacterium]
MPQGFVSFAEVKRAVSMAAVLAHYGLLTDLSAKGQNLVGPCPFCQGKSKRQFQVNAGKNAWYCFGCKEGGNVLDFVAKREGISVRSAAMKLDAWFDLGLAVEKPGTEEYASPAKVPATPLEVAPPAKELPALNPPLTFTLKTLDPHHASLAALGLQPTTLQLFDAGYCTKGLLKGRLAIPIHNDHGELVAYAGLAVGEDETPRYLFPPNFHPALEVMNLHRLPELAGDNEVLYLVPEVEDVLRLAGSGVVAVLGLFDGSLSLKQEEALAGALTLFERLVLVGEDFEDRTVARLAGHAAVRWILDIQNDSLREEEA